MAINIPDDTFSLEKSFFYGDLNMGFFKVLAAVAFPVPSLMYYGTSKAVEYVGDKIDEGKAQSRKEGVKAGEAIASQKYEEKAKNLTSRLSQYHDMDLKVVAMYAIGIAIANADGQVSASERQELDEFVAGCVSAHFADDVKATISSLNSNPPTLARALEFARNAELPKEEIDDIIDLVANADEEINPEELAFIDKWQLLRPTYDAGVRGESAHWC